MDNPLATPEIGLIVWTTIVFVVLLFLLTKFAWKPVLAMVKEREKSIEEALNAAESAKMEMRLLKANNEELLVKAREERDLLLKQAKDTKDQIVAEARIKAKEEADKIIQQARETINNEKLAAMTELKNQVAAISIEIAEKILHAELSSEQKQKHLLDSLVDKVNMN